MTASASSVAAFRTSPVLRNNQVVPEGGSASHTPDVTVEGAQAPSVDEVKQAAVPVRKARPLQGAKADEFLCDNIGQSSEFRGQKSERTFHLFVNETDAELQVFWFYDGGEFLHGDIAPHSNLYVGTYTYHEWRVKDLASGDVMGQYSGDSAIVVVQPGGFDVMMNPSKASTLAGVPVTTRHGVYRRRAVVQDIGIWAFDCVEDAAVERAGQIVTHMLEQCPADLRCALVAAGATLGVVGRSQVVSDLPPHAFMKYNQDRNVDKTARGLGATPHIPVTSVGEENLTMLTDEVFCCQSILVHEFGHLVMNLAFDQERLARVRSLYCDARDAKRYSPDIYCMCNEQEYWASGVEAWFEATIRTDINEGVNTRDKLREHDPGLAALMMEVFGDGVWRYQHDSPLPLRSPPRRQRSDKPGGFEGKGSLGPSVEPSEPSSAGGAAPPGEPASSASPSVSLPPVSSPGLISAPAPRPVSGLTHQTRPPAGKVVLAQARGASSWLCCTGGLTSCLPSWLSACVLRTRRPRDERTTQ